MGRQSHGGVGYVVNRRKMRSSRGGGGDGGGGGERGESDGYVVPLW